MVRTLLLTTLGAALWLGGAAQTALRLTVTDPEGRRLPYATVYLAGKGTGSVADLAGEAKIAPPTAADTLILSAPGYADRRVPAAELAALGGNVALAPQSYAIAADAYTPSPGEKYRYRYLPDYHANGMSLNVKEWRTVAVMVRSTADAGKKIASVMAIISPARINYVALIPKVSMRIMAIGPDGRPGADILKERIEIDPVFGGDILKVNIADLGIRLPDEGLWVGFEWTPSIDPAELSEDMLKLYNLGGWPKIAITSAVRDDVTAYRTSPGSEWLMREGFIEHLRKTAATDTIGAPQYNPAAWERNPNLMIGVKFVEFE